MKNQFLKKKIALILTTIITIMSFSSNMQLTFGSENQKVKESKSKPKIVKELKDLRTKNSTTYLLSDGSRKLEISDANIRYEENGRLKEYKSELRSVSKKEKEFLNNLSKKSTILKSNDVNKYSFVNKSGDAKHYFPELLDKDNEIILQKNKYTIAFAPVFTKKDRAMLKNKNIVNINCNEISENKIEDNKEDSKNGNSITYKNNNIEYKYTSFPLYVKEEIILNEKPHNNVFEFIFDIPGMRLEADEINKIIKIIDINKDKVIAFINSPNIKSENGGIKYDEISYEIEKIENEKYILKVAVDENYLKSPNTKYPVIIDPTVVWMDSYLPSATVSSFIGNSDMNMLNGEWFEVQNHGRTAPFNGTEFRCFICPNGIPLSGGMEQFYGSYIESARLKIVEYSDLTKGAGTIEIRTPNTSWNLNTITWNNKPEMSNKVWAEFITKGVKAKGHYVDLTEWAQAVADREIDNYGLILCAKEKGTRAFFYGSSLQNSRYMQVSIVYWPYKYNINNYYDQAFNARYSIIGNVVTKISEANEIVNGIFEQNLGIYTVNNKPKMVTSLADNCKIQRGVGINLNTIDQICPQNSNHTKVCTLPTNLYYDFISKFSGNQTTASVLWTGNRLYDNQGNNANRSFKGYNNGICLQEIWQPNLYYSMMTSCLAHEMAHIHKAPDHYHEIINEATQECRGGDRCKTCNPETGRDESCLMNIGWMNDIATRIPTTIFCEECLNDMKTYLEANN